MAEVGAEDVAAIELDSEDGPELVAGVEVGFDEEGTTGDGEEDVT